MTDLKKPLPDPSISGNDPPHKVNFCIDPSALCHDVRASLSPIKIYSEMLMSHVSGPLNEKQRRMIETIYRCVGRLEDLVNDVSDMHKLESRSFVLSKDHVDIQDLMDGYAVALRQLILEKQIDLKIEVGMYGKIHVDRNRIGKVITSLVKHAADRVPQTNGKISIKVEKYLSDLLFTVEDNGEAMKKEDLDNTFTTTICNTGSVQSQKYAGSGLNLKISVGIVREHGGKIWVDSKPGCGTAFMFTLPM